MSPEHDRLAERFERERPRLRAIALRMLGFETEAEDALQETWIRLARTDAATIENLEAWLTTVLARVCLNVLESRGRRREESLEGQLPDFAVSLEETGDPEREAELADSVGAAMSVVLATLPPGERIAFVLHDVFAIPFAEIGAILDRRPDAARQLASRGRGRVRDSAGSPAPDAAELRRVRSAFFGAARDGDFGALLELLDPDVVLRADRGPGRIQILHGRDKVAAQAELYSRITTGRPALVDGLPGAVSFRDGELFAVLSVQVRDGRITRMDILSDRTRLARIEL